MEDQHIGLLDTVEDEVLTHHEAAHASVQVLIAFAAKIRIMARR